MAQRRTLETLAARTGFGSINADESGAALPDKTDRRLSFFLFHCQLGNDLLRGTLGRIRDDDQIRFSPAVLIVSECSESDALRYINLGFDDIVVLPEAAKVLERRFTSQMTTPVPYFETATYFGPDRRRSQRLTSGSHPQRGGGEHRHVRYLVQRAPAGVEILRREVVISSTPSVPTSATVNFA